MSNREKGIPLPASERALLVCHHKTCTQQGAADVLAVLRQELPAAVKIQERACLGQCGSGPIIVVLPEEVWYRHVASEDVPAIVQHHFPTDLSNVPQEKDQPSHQSSLTVLWIVLAGIGLLVLGGMFSFLLSQAHYLELR